MEQLFQPNRCLSDVISNIESGKDDYESLYYVRYGHKYLCIGTYMDFYDGEFYYLFRYIGKTVVYKSHTIEQLKFIYQYD